MSTTLVAFRLATRLDLPGATALGRRVAFEVHLDQLMEALLAQEQADPLVTDPDVSANLETGAVEIHCYVALPFDQVVARADSFIRTAIHTAGGHTPDWGDDAGPDGLEYRHESSELVRT